MILPVIVAGLAALAILLIFMGLASGSPVENTHTGRSRPTLAGVISRRGLYPHPSYVRRVASQSPSSGFRRRALVTGG